MIPWVTLASVKLPDGNGTMTLRRHGTEYVIAVGSSELMTSHSHGSEEELARLSLERFEHRKGVRALVGGLGMGFTLSAALRHLQGDARVDVAELIGAVVDWNRGELADLAARPLDDKRVTVEIANVRDLIRNSHDTYDAVILDVDNGPDGLTQRSNYELYSDAGLRLIRSALRPGGVFSLWSAGPNAHFSKRLGRNGFRVREERVPARAGRRGARHTIWLATRGS